MSFISKGYEQLCNLIIRPPRFVYDPTDLGSKEFYIGGKHFVRTDLELVNKRGLTIQASHYHPKVQNKKLPCVIYCHGNCGSRLDGIEAVRCLLQFCTIFTLDFTGSGLSDGEWVSLGCFEKEDLEAAVGYLRSTDKITTIGLWGRSMGAATSIYYGMEDPSIAGMVLDSCYSSLSKVSEELVSKVNAKIPKMLIGLGLKIVRGTIKTKAKFDINDLEPVKFVDKCFIPVLFAHGISDEFILPHHTDSLYAKYAGDKNLIMLEGDHNSPRPEFFYDSVSIFFQNTLCKGEVDPTTVCSPEDPEIEENWKSIPNDAPLGFYVNDTPDEEDEELQAAIKASLLVNQPDLIEIQQNEIKEPQPLITTTTTTSTTTLTTSPKPRRGTTDSVNPEKTSPQATRKKDNAKRRSEQTIFPAESFL